MKTLGYVNQFGRGIKMVQEELEANKNGLPAFKFDDITTFKAIVMNADPKTDGAENGADGAENGADILTAKEKDILVLIKEDHSISRKAIAEKLGIGTTTVYRHIDSLKEKGVIERIGSDKGGYWKVKIMSVQVPEKSRDPVHRQK